MCLRKICLLSIEDGTLTRKNGIHDAFESEKLCCNTVDTCQIVLWIEGVGREVRTWVHMIEY